MRRNERGAVTAFVAVFTMALVLMAGLVVDGGHALAARRRAINEAESAARAGAQAVLTGAVRTSPGTALDPGAARARAEAYLRVTGHPGAVAVTGDRVQVTVTIEQPLVILGAAGLASVTVTGQGEARAVRGVLEEGA